MDFREPTEGERLLYNRIVALEAEYNKERDRADALVSDQSLRSVLQERQRQEMKWGEQNHDPFTYLAVLTEEVGELAQAALHTRFGGSKAAGLREEAVHTAAVALAIVQCLDRDKWQWPQAAGDYKQD